MREIEFRAWDREEQNYIFFDAINGLLSKCDETYRQRCVCGFEQYTGLKDKNGKKIFEGDIILIHNPTQRKKPYKCEVYFNKNIAAFEGKCEEVTYSLFLHNNDIDANKPELLKLYRVLEIIGTIHDKEE